MTLFNFNAFSCLSSFCCLWIITRMGEEPGAKNLGFGRIPFAWWTNLVQWVENVCVDWNKTVLAAARCFQLRIREIWRSTTVRGRRSLLTLLVFACVCILQLFNQKRIAFKTIVGLLLFLRLSHFTGLFMVTSELAGHVAKVPQRVGRLWKRQGTKRVAQSCWLMSGGYVCYSTWGLSPSMITLQGFCICVLPSFAFWCSHCVIESKTSCGRYTSHWVHEIHNPRYRQDTS